MRMKLQTRMADIVDYALQSPITGQYSCNIGCCERASGTPLQSPPKAQYAKSIEKEFLRECIISLGDTIPRLSQHFCLHEVPLPTQVTHVDVSGLPQMLHDRQSHLLA